MNFIVPLKYIYKNISLFSLKSDQFGSHNTIVFIPYFSIYYLNMYLKYSYFFKFLSLIDFGVYEIPSIIFKKQLFYKYVVWYIYKNVSDNLIFLFSTILNNQLKTVEFLFRNMKWLEREASDFFNIFFINKKDRRSLFTIPLIYEAPLRKKFPAVGFYEIFVCFYTKKIKFKHVSLKN